MSLYNLLHGVNPFSPLLLSFVGVEMNEVPRFRDVRLEERQPGELMVVLHTRTGGGNRECYCEGPEGEHEDGCYAVMNRALAQKPSYLNDRDDDFDCTYADFFFRVPADLQATVQEIAAMGGKGEEPRVAWDRVLAKLRTLPVDSADEEMRNALAVGRPIVEAITKAIAGDGSAVVEV